MIVHTLPLCESWEKDLLLKLVDSNKATFRNVGPHLRDLCVLNMCHIVYVSVFVCMSVCLLYICISCVVGGRCFVCHLWGWDCGKCLYLHCCFSRCIHLPPYP